MNLFGHLSKATRWVASSLAGKKGRDAVDKYAPVIESCVAVFIPQLEVSDGDFFNQAVKDWGHARGVPLEDLEGFLAAVKAKK